ncbi:MAG: uroporphyrinogen-III synthase [Nitratireductor sp.]|nr:uroporphyrinogen-III synthase [Nitratireductor sp.]
MRVLLTRARERSEKTARKLKAAGHEAIILPLVDYRDTSAAVPAGHYDAVAFTSAEAVRSLARRIAADPGLTTLFSLPAFCVGAATAQACRAAGFHDVRSADGDADALAGLIASSPPEMLSLLYPAQPGRTLDLAAALPERKVAEFHAYEAVPGDPGVAAMKRAIEACDVVFLYSSNSASHFVDLLRANGMPASFARLTLIVISEKTARAITTGRAEWAKEAGIRIEIAASPDEDAMVSLLGGGPGARRPDVPPDGTPEQ